MDLQTDDRGDPVLMQAPRDGGLLPEWLWPLHSGISHLLPLCAAPSLAAQVECLLSLLTCLSVYLSLWVGHGLPEEARGIAPTTKPGFCGLFLF